MNQTRAELEHGNLDKLCALANLNGMRFLLLALIGSLLAGCATTPKTTLTSVGIDEIKTRYINAGHFKRISEYFTGKEYFGDRLILRSKPQERAGYYFIIILEEDVRRLPKGTQIIGEFYTPDSVEKQTYTFTLPMKRAKTQEIFVGLTGEDWPQKNRVPAAWRFTIIDANGAQLAEKQSYLWSL